MRFSAAVLLPARIFSFELMLTGQGGVPSTMRLHRVNYTSRAAYAAMAKRPHLLPDDFPSPARTPGISSDFDITAAEVQQLLLTDQAMA